MIHEIPPSDMVETRQQKSTLGDVITRCRDASITYRAAAAIPSAHRDALMVASRRRSSFAQTLSHFLKNPDGANELGSITGRTNRWAFKMRSTLLGQTHLGDSVLACVQADEKATHSYVDALGDVEWNDAITGALELQMDEIEKSTEHMRKLRGQL